MRIWLFRKSEPKWRALLPPHWFSGWESSKLSYCLMLMLLHAGAGIRGGDGFEARDEFRSDPHRQSLQPLGENSKEAQGDFFFYAYNLSHTGLC